MPKNNLNNSHAFEELVVGVCALARRAGKETLKYYGRKSAVQTKSDDSPLTKADLASNHIICEGLSKLDDSPLISEEKPLPSWARRKSWKRFWLIDPLDGTKEFIKKNDEFTVNIALIENGVPVIGVVYAPALDLEYFGAKGLGSWRRKKGGRWEQIYCL